MKTFISIRQGWEDDWEILGVFTVKRNAELRCEKEMNTLKMKAYDTEKKPYITEENEEIFEVKRKSWNFDSDCMYVQEEEVEETKCEQCGDYCEDSNDGSQRSFCSEQCKSRYKEEWRKFKSEELEHEAMMENEKEKEDAEDSGVLGVSPEDRREIE